MRLLGINYDVGSYLTPDRPSRPQFDPRTAQGEIRTIARELRCTAVRITGDDPARLRTAAELALGEGLLVYLSPLRHNLDQGEALRYLAETARLAEELRQHGEVVFVVGLEVTFFLKGFLLGPTPLDRIRTAMRPWRLLWSMVRLGNMRKRLNAYLAQAVATVREQFGGPVTYASGPWEEVDWTPFDIVGVNLYRDRRNRSRYREHLRRYANHGKPVVLTEFGCCTYRDAPDLGAMGWSVVDRAATPPRWQRPVVRDEHVQATEIMDLLDIYHQEPVDGAFVFTWANYTYPWNDDPARNLDTASFGIVAVRPDGSWQPKEAFRTLARSPRALPPRGERVDQRLL